MKTLIYPRKLQRKGFCISCGVERSISRRAIDHRVQLALTLLTCGLWGVAWISAWWGERDLVWRCRMCRREVSPPATPPVAAGTPAKDLKAAAPPEVVTVAGTTTAASFGPIPRNLPRYRDGSFS